MRLGRAFAAAAVVGWSKAAVAAVVPTVATPGTASSNTVVPAGIALSASPRPSRSTTARDTARDEDGVTNRKPRIPTIAETINRGPTTNAFDSRQIADRAAVPEDM